MPPLPKETDVPLSTVMLPPVDVPAAELRPAFKTIDVDVVSVVVTSSEMLRLPTNVAISIIPDDVTPSVLSTLPMVKPLLSTIVKAPPLAARVPI